MKDHVACLSVRVPEGLRRFLCLVRWRVGVNLDCCEKFTEPQPIFNASSDLIN